VSLGMCCANGSSTIGDAFRSEGMEKKLRARQLKSHIHHKGKRGKPLTAQAKGSKPTVDREEVGAENRNRSARVRAIFRGAL